MENEISELITWLRREAQFLRCANPTARRGEALDESKCLEKAKRLNAAADHIRKLEKEMEGFTEQHKTFLKEFKERHPNAPDCYGRHFSMFTPCCIKDKFMPGNKIVDKRGDPDRVWRIVSHLSQADGEHIRLVNVSDPDDTWRIQCPHLYGEESHFRIIEAKAAISGH